MRRHVSWKKCSVFSPDLHNFQIILFFRNIKNCGEEDVKVTIYGKDSDLLIISLLAGVDTMIFGGLDITKNNLKKSSKSHGKANFNFFQKIHNHVQ
jgi:hypothetical protein